MTYVLFIFLIIFACLGVVAWLAIWSRKDWFGRHLAILMFVLFIPLGFVSMIESLGWAKPLWAAYELRNTDKYLVLGAKLVNRKAIYVFIDLPNSSEPRTFRLPWNKDVAKELQDKLNNPDNDGNVIMNFEWSWNTNPPQFHDLPQQKLLPDKPVQEKAPVFEQGA